MKSRGNTVYLSALVLLSVVLWLPRLQGPLDFRWDGATYYVLGKSLAEGKGYRLLNEPGEIQAIQYPPLLPIIAAVHQALAGTTDPAVAGHWLRLSFFAIFIGYIIVAYGLSRFLVSPFLGFLVSMITLLHMKTTFLSDLFFAELPFALTTLVSLFFAVRGNRMQRYWGAGLFGAASFLLRINGIVLLAAWIGESLTNRRFREMGSRALFALFPIIGWQAYIVHVQNSLEYAQSNYEYQRAPYQYYNVGYIENLAHYYTPSPEVGTPPDPEVGGPSPELFVKQVIRNLVLVPVSIGAGVSAGPLLAKSALQKINASLERVQVPPWIVEMPLFFLGVIVLCGLMLLAVRGEWIIPLYVGGTVAVICLTPWARAFERFLTPVTPLLALALFVALVKAREYLSTVARGKWAWAGVALFTMVTSGIFVLEAGPLYKIYQSSQKVYSEDENGQQVEYRLFWYSPSFREYDEALRRLKEIANPGEIIATTHPPYGYLKTGRLAVTPPLERDVGKAQRLIDSVPVNYLVIDSLGDTDFSPRYALPVVQAFPLKWEMIYSTENGTSRIYRRVGGEQRTISPDKTRPVQSGTSH